MPKVKAKRHSVSLDMTAMCDVAFLLLTFFMLTAKFRPEEAVTITPPSSISEKPLNIKDGMLMVSVSPEGGVYLATDDQMAREFMLERMANSSNNELSYWVGYAKLSNPELKVAIKGDKESNYKVFADIIGTLQAQNINIFQLVTGPENKPK